MIHCFYIALISHMTYFSVRLPAEDTYQRKRMLPPLLFAGFFYFALPSAGQPVFPDSPEPWREAYEITLKGFEFTHPMTVINREELMLIKKRIQYGK